ncbi:uncharacterized protein LOC125952190 isoform X2 [Anopheles darlingi]|uniref:uncharacterized protein LOC125952190 isoform X2 n=1 Tax=Anopheles darlingi TaxID=43151 RepID=UPI0021005757|nr:uncharacterized protein LOC125952190 isoform X2 [Anopheles darlingi]
MLSGRIRRRALALLGALLLVILVWPPCGASMPTALPPVIPWQIVPPTRPHPAATMLPVPLPLNPPHTVDAGGPRGPLTKRSPPTDPRDQQQTEEEQPNETTVTERRGQQQQQQQQTYSAVVSADPRSSRWLSEFRRFMRVLKLGAVGATDTHGRQHKPFKPTHQTDDRSDRRQYACVDGDGGGGSSALNAKSEPTVASTPAGVTVNSDGGDDSAVQPHENSGPRLAKRDYLIEPFDKNKSQSAIIRPASGNVTTIVAGARQHAKFDDTVADDKRSWRWWWRWQRRPIDHLPSFTSGADNSQRPSEHVAIDEPIVSRTKRNANGAASNPHRHQHKLPANGTGAGHNRRPGGRSHHQQQQQQQQQQQVQLQQQQHQQQHNESNLERNERSANLSHVSGATRKIQLFIKNRYIQLLPDGTVNGTHDDLSDYTILQRTTVGIGQIKIQAVATCLFLCMDTCGSVYGSKEFTEDCVFNEQMEQHHYNTYSSTQHSNARRTLYLALNKTGQPRKIQIPVNRTLGKLATYTKALTQTVAHDRVEQLISRLFGADHVRHGLNQLCEAGQPLEELTTKELRPRPVCGAQTGGPKSQGGTGANGGASKQSQAASAPGKEGLRQTKKKKKRRKCRDDEVPGEHCFRHGGQGAGLVGLGTNSGGKKKAGQNQGLASHRAGSSISSGSSSSNGPSISNSSVGSSSAGDNGTSINSSANSSAASSLASSISNGGPNRQGLPYALLSTTPNARKSAKPTKKMAGSGGNRSGNGASSSSAGGSGSSQTRKPKKPAPQQQQNQQPSGFGKRNGTAGNQGKVPGSGKSKLVPVSSMVIGKVSPKPASLLSGRTPRNTTPFPTTTMTSAASTISAAVNHLEDTSQQLDDLDPSPESELDMGDVLQPSAELVDEDELDEGNLNLAGHAINFVEEEDLDDLEF